MIKGMPSVIHNWAMLSSFKYQKLSSFRDDTFSKEFPWLQPSSGLDDLALVGCSVCGLNLFYEA